MQSFDFDEWATLYQKNPAEFAARRQAVLEGMIAQSRLSEAQKNKLRDTLFATATPGEEPMDAILRAQRQMWETFSELQTQLRSLHVSANQDGSVSVRKSAVAQFTV